jgi:hypothetical protein
MPELTCDGETGGARADDNSVAAVLDVCSHGDLLFLLVGEGHRFGATIAEHERYDCIVTISRL